MWWSRKVKYEELKNKLDNGLFQYFSKIDFNKDNEDLIYKRKTNFGYEIFELEYLISSKDLKLMYGLRFNEIEDIYDSIHKINSPQNSYTLFVDSINIVDQKDTNRAKFKFTTIEDVNLGIRNTEFIFEHYAEKHFAKYGSISKFSNLVNREEDQEGINWNNEDAAINGIIASKILEDKDTEDLKVRHLANNPNTNLRSIFRLIDEHFSNKRSRI